MSFENDVTPPLAYTYPLQYACGPPIADPLPGGGRAPKTGRLANSFRLKRTIRSGFGFSPENGAPFSRGPVEDGVQPAPRSRAPRKGRGAFAPTSHGAYGRAAFCAQKPLKLQVSRRSDYLEMV